MTTTPRDTPDTRAKRRPPPRQRTGSTAPKGYATARAAFENRAHDWLRDRHDRITYMPADLHLVAALGVPCSSCGALVYRNGDAGHTISWKPTASWSARNSGGPDDRHWATGITATCQRAGR